MSIVKDDLGDRMKMLENMTSSTRMMPLLPVFARIDGRAFHSFTRGMKRPYDGCFSSMMVDTTLFLAKETNARIGYTQSDEITLMWLSEDYRSQIIFDGRHSKMVSQLAAMATLKFYQLVVERMPGYASKFPTFDCRVWQVPNKMESVNVFVWREWDAVKNSISMAAQSVYSHRELHGKNGKEKQEMLHRKGINWNDYPVAFKRGTYVQRRTEAIAFTPQEIEKLPMKHEARTNPDLVVERSKFVIVDMPPITKVVNVFDAIFDGAVPCSNPTRGSK